LFVLAIAPTALAQQTLWTHQFGSYDGGHRLQGIHVDTTGIYVAGLTATGNAGNTSSASFVVTVVDTTPPLLEVPADMTIEATVPAAPELWTRQFGSPREDRAHTIAVFSARVYVAGRTLGSAGYLDAFVRQYSVDGGEHGTHQFGSNGHDSAWGITADASGVYVAGGTGGVLRGQSSAGGIDAFVRYYTHSGRELWTLQFGTAAFDRAWAITADASGVYVAGQTGGVLSGQSTAGERDAFVRKYYRSRDLLWTRQFGSNEHDRAQAVTTDASGVYVAGETGGALPGQSSAGWMDAFIRKYDSEGNELWTRQFGSNTYDRAWAITADASGVYVAGETGGVLSGQSSAGRGDAFIRKYDSEGNELWTRQFGSDWHDRAQAITADASGVYVAGGTAGVLSGQSSAGGRDAFIRKYDSEGNELWTRQFGSNTYDRAWAITADASGVYVAGETGDALLGQSSAGAEDAFIRKYALIGGTPVPFDAAATDNADPSPAVSCTPSSGSTFPLGSTTVTCTATDNAGNTSSASFVVTVVDTTPPLLEVPSDMVVEASSPTGAVVSFAVSAQDAVDPSPTITCAPSTGTTFPVGSTTVTCTATDAADNTTERTFVVTVIYITGEIIIDKRAIGGDSTFDYLTSDLPGGDFSITTAAGSGSRNFVAIAPGTYVVREIPLRGWAASLNCVDSDTTGTPSLVAGTEATIRLDARETVTCTFTNSCAVPDVSGINPSSMQSGTTITVTITGSNFGAGATVRFPLSPGPGPPPSASNVVVMDARTITADVTAPRGGPPGDHVFGVSVANAAPCQGSGELAGGFVVRR
jgi:hypothetical protein